MRTMGRSLLALLCCAALLGSNGWTQEKAASDTFAAYTGCSLSDGLVVVETAPLAPGVAARTVRTINGSSSISMLAGRRVMFAYPNEDFYANVKVEILPKEGYGKSKEALVGNFEYMLASGDNDRNYGLKPTLNGFAIQGLDRAKREGGVLGVYLLFDDPTQTVTTIYFLNQEPPKRFKTMEEYALVRNRFLEEYTGCIRGKLRAGPGMTLPHTHDRR